MTNWTRDDICTKWPAVRLSGPRVTREHALDFIYLTDTSFVDPSGWLCNDRIFKAKFRKLFDFPDSYDIAPGGWGEHHERIARWRKANDFVELEHLSSHWVASSYIGGPYGPVAPNGRVELVKNFGKWPSVEEVESDLKALASRFPWLTFRMLLWDSSGEGGAVDRGDAPDMAWHMEGGEWRRADPSEGFAGFDAVDRSFEDEMNRFAVYLRTGMGESTWSVEEIKAMWGARIERARKAADLLTLNEN